MTSASGLGPGGPALPPTSEPTLPQASGTASRAEVRERDREPTADASDDLSPVEQDDGRIDDSESFQDDLVGAQVKSRESADRRAERDRRSSESRRRMELWLRLRASSGFSMERDDDAHRKVMRESQNRTQEKGLRAAEGSSALAADVPLAKAENKAKELLEEIHTLLQRIDAAGGLEALGKACGGASEAAALPAGAARLLELAGRLASVEAEAKDILAHMLTGGIGLRLSKDPRLTFRALFDRIDHWPVLVPPGERPRSPEDLDAFVSWIFAPPPPPDDEELRW